MKIKRHSKLLELIEKYDIETQEELLRRLNECGFNVTQATISRDIKELRLVKVLGDNGKYKYTTNKTKDVDSLSKFYTVFTSSVTEIDYAGNTVVIQCYNGMAQGVCAALDAVHWEGIVGTIAGDDTIFILCRTENYALTIVDELKKMI